MTSRAILGVLLLSASTVACPGGPITVDAGDASPPRDAGPRITEDVDLLLVVDNTSTRDGQTRLMAQVPAMLDALLHPPDRDGDGRPDHRPVRSLRVGVISTDVGTPGASVRGCDNADRGDDGWLNPIRYGEAMARHEPWTAAPVGFRPDDCASREQFPAFLGATPGTPDLAGFVHDVRCNALLYTNGCGLEQPLEAIRRALIVHRAGAPADARDTNAGFLREDAVLAIVVLTDEEDGSVRDCRYAEPGDTGCRDATGVFQSNSTGWAYPNLNMRFYMYTACGDDDPTWNLDRYLDPRDPARGIPGLKPGHAERVVFAALTGVPLRVPTRGAVDPPATDWDALLGPPGAGGRDDYCGRQGALAYDEPGNPLGPTSLRPAYRDPNPNCTDRVVPGCRLERSEGSYNPALPPCSPTEQYFAWPARRIVELARRFDEAPLCAGRPCRNGIVRSICALDFGPAMGEVVARIQSHLDP